MRKLRPIACAECLMKLVESIEIEAQISDILTKFEPAQVGCGTPDAAPLVVYIARTWATAVLEAAENGTPSEGTQILAGLDLENAYGRAHRSTCLEGCKNIAPRLARLAAMQWSAGGNVVWQRSSGGWRQSRAERGGWQGARLMQLIFAMGLEHAFLEVPELKGGTAATRIGLQDDTYFSEQQRRFPNTGIH
jgi:hypothetical protein